MELNLDVFTAFPELETRRLFLRELQDSDADAIQAMRSSKAVNRFIARNDTITSEEAQNLTEKSRQAFENRTGIAWAGVRKGTDAFIGACGFNRIDFQNLRAEIGGEMSIQVQLNFILRAPRAINALPCVRVVAEYAG